MGLCRNEAIDFYQSIDKRSTLKKPAVSTMAIHIIDSILQKSGTLLGWTFVIIIIIECSLLIIAQTYNIHGHNMLTHNHILTLTQTSTYKWLQ